MIVEYIRYNLKNTTAIATFTEAYAQAAKALVAAPECLDFELTQCEEEPSRFILRIEWTSTKDHLQGFRKGKHFPAFLREIRPYIGEIEEMQHYANVPIGSNVQPQTSEAP